MSSGQVGAVLRYLRQVAVAGGDEQLPDHQLLHRFATQRDQDAYATLLKRHGPMVLGVCRSVLRDPHDAEDAFQATFVVLAQKAGLIQRKEAVSSWLYRVAYRVAARARASAARRRARESKAVMEPAPDPLLDMNLRELRAALYEELQRLPEKYRGPLVLCYLEEKTHEEAAHVLGWSKGAVKGRLERGRARLRTRLARRGLELSLGLFAAGLAHHPASAAVAAWLADSTLQAGLTLAAEKTATTGVISAEVAALVQGVGTSVVSSKLKVVTVLLLALGVGLAGLGVLGHTLRAAKQADPPPVQAGKPEAAGPAKADASDTVRVHGRVLDTEDRPVAGAKLYLGPVDRKHPTFPVRATSGSDGRFTFTFAWSELDRTYSKDPSAEVLAVARDGGSDWTYFRPGVKDGEVTLRLGKEVPVRGQILNSDGRPVAGARVRVACALSFPGRKFDDVLDDFRKSRVEAINQSMQAWTAPLPGQPAVVTAGADGRIRLAGFGGDRLLSVRVEGPGIAPGSITVLTRPGKPVVMEHQSYYPATFEYVAQISRPIRGVVRDKLTHKPLAGVEISSWNQKAVTDRDGRYELLGVPKAPRYDLEVKPANGQAYFAGTIDVADTPGLDPVPADIELVRGIALRGRVTDQATGKPIAGAAVEYHALFPNPHIGKLAAFPGGYGPHAAATTVADGRFELAVLPGPGVLGVTAPQPSQYMPALVTTRDVRDFFKGPVRSSYTEEQDLTVAAGGNAMSFIVQAKFNALVLLDPDEKATSLGKDVALEPGRIRKGSVVGPDGKPLTGVTVYGLTWGESQTLKTDAFAVGGLNPRRARNLLFVDRKKNLGAYVVLRGTDATPLTIKLEPCGSATGRIVDKEGQPVAGLRLALTEQGLAGLGVNLPFTTDHAGRFRVSGLVGGMPYNVMRYRPSPYSLGNVVVESSKTKDVGDIQGHLDDQ